MPITVCFFLSVSQYRLRHVISVAQAEAGRKRPLIIPLVTKLPSNFNVSCGNADYVRTPIFLISLSCTRITLLSTYLWHAHLMADLYSEQFNL